MRAVSGEETGLAYSDELMLPALEHAAGAARAIARQGESRQVPAWQRGAAAPLGRPPGGPLLELADVDGDGDVDGIDVPRTHLPKDLFRPIRILQIVDSHQLGCPADM